MRLTRFTDNALRCLTVLALDADTAVTVPDLARRMRMSEDHLAKVVAHLATLEIVTTTRGRSGGVQLLADPTTMRIGDVVRATEASFALVECFNPATSQCPIALSCVLAQALDRALAAFLGVLDELTLADLVRSPRSLRRLLET